MDQPPHLHRPRGDKGPGIGLQFPVHGLDDVGWKAIVVADKSGTRVILSNGK